jgi:hypothetical protein
MTLLIILLIAGIIKMVEVVSSIGRKAIRFVSERRLQARLRERLKHI